MAIGMEELRIAGWVAFNLAWAVVCVKSIRSRERGNRWWEK